jgi:hypothetical protein
MNRIAKYATAAALAGALAIPAVTPSSAATWHHGHGGIGAGAAVGFAAGALVGAAATSAAYGPTYGYAPGYPYQPGYAYAPGYAYDSYDAAYAYEPGPAYGAYAYQPAAPRTYRTYTDRNEQRCTLSPASVNYVPCNNQW